MRLGQFFFAVLVSCDVWSLTLYAQQPTTELRIKLNPIDNAPISGALIALLDARDSVVAEGLGSANGVRLLHATRRIPHPRKAHWVSALRVESSRASPPGRP